MSKILVIDDDAAIRDLCYTLFTQKGYDVITAARGVQGLSIIGSEKPDLVLMDIQIPGENGLSLLKKLRDSNPRLPIVVFSGCISAEIEKDAFEAGAIEMIQKGIEAKKLLEKIQRIIEAKHRIFQESPSESKREKILIVDDEEGIRHLLKEFFMRKGFKTFLAQNGEEAIVLARIEKPSVALLDITMPGMDGILTLKKLKEIDSELGVVMATSLEDEGLKNEAMALGAYSYVLKPFDLQYLELVVLTRLKLAAAANP